MSKMPRTWWSPTEGLIQDVPTALYVRVADGEPVVSVPLDAVELRPTPTRPAFVEAFRDAECTLGGPCGIYALRRSRMDVSHAARGRTHGDVGHAFGLRKGAAMNANDTATERGVEDRTAEMIRRVCPAVGQDDVAIASALATAGLLASAGQAELVGLAHWLVSMDDPDNSDGMSDRQTVTLTQIIERARDALAAGREQR